MSAALAALGGYPSLHLMTTSSDLIGEVEILGPLGAKEARNGISTDMVTFPDVSFWPTVEAKVITPLKGCRTGDIIQVDLYKGDNDAVLSYPGEHRLMFLRRTTSGRYAVTSRTLDLTIQKGRVNVSWRTHELETSLTNVLAQIRSAVSANMRDEQLDVTLVGPIMGAHAFFSLAISNRGPEAVDIRGPMTKSPYIGVAPSHDREKICHDISGIRAVTLEPRSSIDFRIDLAHAFKYITTDGGAIWVSINGRESNRIGVAADSAIPQNNQIQNIGTNAPNSDL